MTSKADRARIEENFRSQYLSLDDDVLREIVLGAVPWANGGSFVFEARRAAHAILVERKAHDIPALPAWDPSSPNAPTLVRVAVVVGTMILAAGAAVGYATLVPPDKPTDTEVCSQAADLIRQSDFAHTVSLSTSRCRVDHGSARQVRDSGQTRTPVTFRACLQLDANVLGRLQRTGSPWDINRVQRFARTPSPGEHCFEGAAPLAELVIRDGRPWHVTLSEHL